MPIQRILQRYPPRVSDRIFASGWFKIDTPLGSYNPDWAVLFELGGQEKLYFVVESKGTVFEDMLRDVEQAKIHCGHEHFKALGEDARYMVASNYETFFDQAGKQL